MITRHKKKFSTKLTMTQREAHDFSFSYGKHGRAVMGDSLFAHFLPPVVRAGRKRTTKRVGLGKNMAMT